MSDESLATNPYEPPAAREVGPQASGGAPPANDGRRQVAASFGHFLASIGLGLLTFLMLIATGISSKPGIVGFGIATVVALAGVVRAIMGMVQAVRARRVSGAFTLGVIAAVLANGFMSLWGVVLTAFATNGFARGRQLRRFGRVLLPPVRAGGAWLDLPLAVDVPEPARRGLAARWRENGRTEHASVAAFARLTLDLMALGAPPALVASANRDAIEEIRHTELCFSLARALDSADESPGAFPEASRARTLAPTRTLALAALAVDSLVDGGLHEGVSARVIARLARRCEEPQIRAALKEIAADEGRHATHGWDVVRWCLAEGGEPVADALRGAVLALPKTMRTPLPEAAAEGGWERFGIHGHALEAEEYVRTRADLVRRVEKLVGDARAEAA